ncbi:glycogen operon protein [Rhodobacter aestuarii]|uniref:Glycogen operon protein n=1 Tax=Rhodobacter aestuarii TaxID=453582 RepID=A0A1N7JCK1_9RHOB|nr:glycogen debranching protein GlgX [Rhodobacter aestuarii]PTV96936.1 glycogen operon protein [Rhodobacter aestuarii]SIS47004.1 glycogen operon protein [Rhodobacter aestuarii]
MTIHPGRAEVLGAVPSGGGTNFAVFSTHAEKVELCLFEDGKERRLTLPERAGDIWHGFVRGVGPGTKYGYRVHGPWAPEIGHRFNPSKLLIDPYARALNAPIIWHPLMQGGVGTTRPDRRDSGTVTPKSVVCEIFKPHWERPARSWSHTFIYECHLRGMTMQHPEVPEHLRGTYEGFACPPIIAHLKKLGVTAVEFLPVMPFIDDRFLVEKGLRNYWGYQPISFFAPEPRYGTREGFRNMVRALHAAGIEVILDVVFNHSGEGDGAGPTLSLRGLDNGAYYRLAEGGRTYVNDTGTGNTLNLAHPMVLRMVTDSLRHWVEEMGVDGFRFDLAANLGRGASGRFKSWAPLLSAIRQDPVLGAVKLIAEPWDIGPGGYRLGDFPYPFIEWNDRYRDGLRQFWRVDAGQIPELARRVAGSAEIFDHRGRAATSSLNFLTAHDGFTLQDLVSFNEKRNEANGENNRDGHNANYSQALASAEERGNRKRALLATLMLSQGVPMLLGGDEIGNSQLGNNNAYAQDNPIGWIDWSSTDTDLVDFVARLAKLRHDHPVLRQSRFLHAKVREQDGIRDLIWRMPSGGEPTPQDWHDAKAHCLCAEVRGAAEGPAGQVAHEAFFIVFNAGPQIDVTLPEGHWRKMLDTAQPKAPESPHSDPVTCVFAQSVQLFIRSTAR